MNIQILDSWLREHITTNANAHELASSLSLCGPSFDRVDEVKIDGKRDYVYDIEVTTNRVDMMSVYGIAREATVILPEFGFKAKLKPIKKTKIVTRDDHQINLKVDRMLTSRVMGVVLEVPEIGKSPKWMITRLESSGMRSLNLPVDITNYVMLEVGHPTHVFDYDLVKPNMTIRTAKSNESIVSLENKTYILEKGDIVIDNGNGEIIDLPGIIGTRNSVVNENTRRILYFMETNDPIQIRRTSIRLGIRTNAAVLNEKGVDPYLAEVAMNRGIELFQNLAGAKVSSKVYDQFVAKPKVNKIEVKHSFIEKILGVQITSVQVLRILKDLEFEVKLTKGTYLVTPPTFRAKDIEIPEDVVEEIARIYGYHKLPSILMSGIIPNTNYDSPFAFETAVKHILSGLGANEIYSNSLVPASFNVGEYLEICNPLGSDTSSLRSNLQSSLIQSAKTNKNIDHFHLFEIANIYIPQSSLPEELMTLSGIMKGYDYKTAKGMIEAFLNKLRIVYKFEQKDSKYFKPNQRIVIGDMGEFGTLINGLIYYSFDLNTMKQSQTNMKYTPIPKFPAQIEDITINIVKGTHISNVVDSLVKVDERIDNIEYVGSYKGNHTLRVYYQDPQKTLNNKDVDKVRNKLITKIISMGLSIKE